MLRSPNTVLPFLRRGVRACAFPSDAPAVTIARKRIIRFVYSEFHRFSLSARAPRNTVRIEPGASRARACARACIGSARCSERDRIALARARHSPRGRGGRRASPERVGSCVNLRQQRFYSARVPRPVKSTVSGRGIKGHAFPLPASPRLWGVAVTSDKSRAELARGNT